MAPAPDSPAAPASAWRDLRVRAISAAILAPIGLAALWWGGHAWHGLILLVGVGMAIEWLGMGRRSVHRHAVMLLVIVGFCYVAPAIWAMIWLRDAPGIGRLNVLFVVLVVWASDIGAYVAGRQLGGPKLAPSISPGKTWTGAGGGLVAAMAVGGVAAFAWHSALAPGVLAAGLLGVVSQAGDLLESAIKRHFGVKDSGRLIPGHGGLLDRLDGVLAAAPAAAVLAWALGQGKLLWQ